MQSQTPTSSAKHSAASALAASLLGLAGIPGSSAAADFFTHFSRTLRRTASFRYPACHASDGTRAAEGEAQAAARWKALPASFQRPANECTSPESRSPPAESGQPSAESTAAARWTSRATDWSPFPPLSPVPLTPSSRNECAQTRCCGGSGWCAVMRASDVANSGEEGERGPLALLSSSALVFPFSSSSEKSSSRSPSTPASRRFEAWTAKR